MAARVAVAAAAVAAAAVAAAAAAAPSDPSYDHQTVTYTAQFAPVNNSGAEVYLTPFFSPEHASDTMVSLINSVAPGGRIDIATPGFDSWGKFNCTFGPDPGCIGCTIAEMAAEPFPVFPAILNAIHTKGAVVRVVVNDYNQPTCAGKISALDYWALNGVAIAYYTSTTFMHAKYTRVETATGNVTAVSSINFSKTSYTENREAGMLINESTAAGAALAALTVAAFAFDFAGGTPYTVSNTYSPSQMAAITTTTPYPVVVPTPNITGSYVTPPPYPIMSYLDSNLYTAPDYSREAVEADFASATSTLEIYIYQITDNSFCSKLLQLYKSGVNVTLLVSHAIYDPTDWHLAQTCYEIMYNGSMYIRKSPTFYEFSHNKFWIVDGNRLRVSTGNMSPSDYPTGYVFPPYPSPQWQNTNRDFSIEVTSDELAAFYRAVMKEDWSRGATWYPPKAGEVRYPYI